MTHLTTLANTAPHTPVDMQHTAQLPDVAGHRLVVITGIPFDPSCETGLPVDFNRWNILMFGSCVGFASVLLDAFPRNT